MLDEFTKGEIYSKSDEILRHCKGYDIFPTPIDKVIGYTELRVASEINLNHIDDSFLKKFSQAFQSTLGKISGILDRKEKTIYLDLNQKTNRKNFVKLHEVGHNVLPWQVETLHFLDDESTLDPYTQDAFEAEASFFASATIFQNGRFEKEVKKLPLEIGTSIHLAKFFGASVHATLRRFVEYSKSKCALLVLENPAIIGVISSIGIRDYFQSPLFTEAFGVIQWGDKLKETWPFVQDIAFGRRMVLKGIVSLTTNDGEVQCQYQFFNNTYNSFVLIFPKGEGKKKKVKFVANL